MSEAVLSPKRDAQICALIGTGHFLSHFYMLCLAPLFLVWRDEFGVSFATLGLAVALMSATTAVLQTPVGFLVDKYGARRFLVGGTLIMALSISAMSFVTDFRLILALAVLSGIGNSVIHPADYAILAGSIRKEFVGRAFALHTFTGNLGFALAPPTVALLLLVMDWRHALLLLGLLGVPVVGAILFQARILSDQPKARGTQKVSSRELLLSKPILAFFAFFLLSAMSGAGISAFLITVLGKLWETPIAVASLTLTGYMVGATCGTLVGGWYTDKKGGGNLMGFVTVLTLVAGGLLLSMGTFAYPDFLLPIVALVAGICMGSSRTPRDVMLKDACPPGEIGKVFGFVSAGLPLGSALMPVPMGLLIDYGFTWLVLPVVAILLVLSLLCAGGARSLSLARRMPVQPAE
ncbi:MFS transporter [Roseococcus pinisoli]|uniref:MFS transporter n=1 Tax=Roseococcus pinisoli TaxID=2835040 RepID=A0ABS5QAB1_9PROT|nr:MFS transporter [Roseococcus pinisoli]MBS7810649.1 MFS transporter [Roseococcus pinisoli]